MEVGRVIVEDDRIAVPERSRFAIKDADGFDEGDVTGYSFGRRCTGLISRIVSAAPADERILSASISEPSSSFTAMACPS